MTRKRGLATRVAKEGRSTLSPSHRDPFAYPANPQFISFFFLLPENIRTLSNKQNKNNNRVQKNKIRMRWWPWEFCEYKTEKAKLRRLQCEMGKKKYTTNITKKSKFSFQQKNKYSLRIRLLMGRILKRIRRLWFLVSEIMY